MKGEPGGHYSVTHRLVPEHVNEGMYAYILYACAVRSVFFVGECTVVGSDKNKSMERLVWRHKWVRTSFYCLLCGHMGRADFPINPEGCIYFVGSDITYRRAGLAKTRWRTYLLATASSRLLDNVLGNIRGGETRPGPGRSTKKGLQLLYLISLVQFKPPPTSRCVY